MPVFTTVVRTARNRLFTVGLAACMGLATLPAAFSYAELTNTTTYTTTTATTDDDSGLTSYQRLENQITSLKAEAMVMLVKINKGDNSVTSTQYNLKLQQIADLEAAADALQSEQATDNSSSSSSGSSSSGSSTMDTIKNAAIAGATQSVVSSLLGGGTGTTGGIGGLSGLTGGLGGLTNGIGGIQTSIGQALTAGMGLGTPATAATVASNGVAKNISTPDAAKPTDKVSADTSKQTACTDDSAPVPTPKPAQATGPESAADNAGGDSSGASASNSSNPLQSAVDSAGGTSTATAAAAPASTAGTLPKCSKPDPSTPNPVGHGGKFNSKEEAEAFVAAQNGECITSANSSAANKCECASLAKGMAGLGLASSWKQGADATPGMDPGAIATMNDGGYCSAANPGGVHGCHAAYFVGTFNGQNVVVEQWNKSGGPMVSTWSDAKLAKYSRVISGDQQSRLFHPFLEGPLWMVLKLSPQPLGMGLLKA